MIKEWRNGMMHSVPVSATFTMFKYINITPSFSFKDRMYSNKIMQSWDETSMIVKRDTMWGFYNVYNWDKEKELGYHPIPGCHFSIHI